MRNKISLKEIIATAAIITVCCLGLLIYKLSGSRGRYAVITVNSQKIMERELSDDGEFETDSAEGVVFQVKDGGIRVKSSDCPDKVCVHTGFIYETNEKIVCMPKKLVVEIED